MDVDDEIVLDTCVSILSFLDSEIAKDVGERQTDAMLEKLTCFAEMLALKEQGLFRGLDFEHVARVYVRVLDGSENGAIDDQALTCISGLLDNFSDARQAFMGSDILSVIQRKMPQFKPMAASTAIEAVRLLAGVDAAAVGLKFSVESIIERMDGLLRTACGKAMGLVKLLIEAGQPVSGQTIGVMMNMIRTQQHLAEMASGALMAAIERVSVEELTDDVYDTITYIINTCTDARAVKSTVKMLRKVRKNPVVAGKIVNCHLDYRKLLFWMEPESTGRDIRRDTLFFLCEMMTRVGTAFKSLHGLDTDEKDPTTIDVLLRDVRPVMEEYVLGSNLFSDLAWLVLGNCVKIDGVISTELCARMVERANETFISGHILRIALGMTDKKLIVGSGLLEILERELAFKNDEMKNWFPMKMELLRKQVADSGAIETIEQKFGTIEEMDSFIETKKCSTWSFIQSGLPDVAIALLRGRDGPVKCDLSHIFGIVRDRLGMLSIPVVEDMFKSRRIDSFVDASISYTVMCDGNKTTNVAVPVLSSFVAIEAQMNERNDVPKESIKQAFPEMSEGRYATLSMTEIGLIHRFIKTPGYKRYAFRIGERQYTYVDSLYHAGSQSIDEQSEYKSVHPVVEFIDEAVEKPNEKHGRLRIRNMIDLGSKITCLFELAKLIHEANPDLDMTCPAFERSLMKSCESVWMNASGFNPVIAIANEYPYLLGHGLKRALLMTTSFDFRTALVFLHNHILHGDTNYREKRMFWSCTVRRDNLFEDGCKVLKDHGPGNIQLDIEFVGEAGFGSGPARELFTLMSKELMLLSRNLWRSDTISSDCPQYAFTEKGLFPRPDADPELFYIFGILCGKAISMEIVLPVPLGSAFFRLMAGETLQLEDVDPVIAKSLKFKEGLCGMSFVYPGIDAIEMIENGSDVDVTLDNVDEYVKLVVDFTCGSKLLAIRERFNSGFHSVVGYGIWELFTPEEKVSQITGCDVVFTMEDLKKNIQFQHGYSKDSPEVAMLLETIIELDPPNRASFFRFVTGCERLPVGGISAVHPSIAVARSVSSDLADQFLPTASTCTNYLKLPAYSSKEVLKEKLVVAINEGQNAFLLS